MPVPKKLTKEEVQSQLFDALMEQIEPKLMIAARKATAAELAAMDPKTRAEWMQYYQSAYEEFLKHWPVFVAKATKGVDQMGDALVQISGEADATKMQSLEKSFGEENSSAAAA